jgi:aldehyde dehydrogenase (NAD+)
VVAAITPWNFPVIAPLRKVIPALIYGCTVVLKPASQTALSAVLLTEMLHETGLPAGTVNLVLGRGQAIGDTLVTHPAVNGISFTGSTEVGLAIAAKAAANNTKLQLEMGGKNACVVADYADIPNAAKQIVAAAYQTAGQRCTAISRVIVLQEQQAALEAALAAEVGKLHVGYGMDETTTMGPLVSQKQLDTVLGYIDVGRKEGATLATGGVRLEDGPLADGFFVAPTIFTDVRPDMTIAREEIFGPVLSVLRYGDVEEAVALANDSDYGLAGAVWGSPGRAMEVAGRLRAGTVWVNDYHLLSPKYPFGGYKQSGIGREHGWLGLLEYTEAKHVHVGLDPRRGTKRWFDMTVPRRR